MKRAIILVMFICLCCAVYAEEGKVKVYSLKAISGEESVNADWEDDEMDIYSGKTFTVNLRLENYYNYSVEVDVSATLYDINNDDINKVKSVILSAMDEDSAITPKKLVTLEFTIPSTTRNDDYDLEIIYTYEALKNDSTTVYKTYKHVRDFTVTVHKETVSIEDQLIAQQSKVYNESLKTMIKLTEQLNEERNKTNSYLKQIGDLSAKADELSRCQSDLAGLKASFNFSTDFKNKYEGQATVCQSELATCYAAKDTMFTQSAIDQAKKDGEQRASGTYLNYILIVVGGYLLLNWKKKKDQQVGGKGDGTPITGTWK
jgi:hypothetical protein